MTEQIDDGGPAFPVVVNHIDDLSGSSEIQLEYRGMSTRMWLAGLAMQGIVIHRTYCNATSWRDMASAAFDIADAMIKAGGSDNGE